MKDENQQMWKLILDITNTTHVTILKSKTKKPNKKIIISATQANIWEG